MLDQRLPWHQEPVEQLNAEKILMDGEIDPTAWIIIANFH